MKNQISSSKSLFPGARELIAGALLIGVIAMAENAGAQEACLDDQGNPLANCECPSDTHFEEDDGSCVDRIDPADCPLHANVNMDANRCECSDSLHRIFNAGTESVADDFCAFPSSCRATYEPNNMNVCACPDGEQEFSQGTPDPLDDFCAEPRTDCRSDQVLSMSNACACASGEREFSGRCDVPATCGAGQEISADNVCECADDSLALFDNNTPDNPADDFCRLATDECHDARAFFINGQCQCYVEGAANGGYSPLGANEACPACPSTHYDGRRGCQLLRACLGANEVVITDPSNPNVDQCGCLPGFVRQGNSCVQGVNNQQTSAGDSDDDDERVALIAVPVALIGAYALAGQARYIDPAYDFGYSAKNDSLEWHGSGGFNLRHGGLHSYATAVHSSGDSVAYVSGLSYEQDHFALNYAAAESSSEYLYDLGASMKSEFGLWTLSPSASAEFQYQRDQGEWSSESAAGLTATWTAHRWNVRARSDFIGTGAHALDLELRF